MSNCPLCDTPGGDILWQDDFCRVILAGDAELGSRGLDQVLLHGDAELAAADLHPATGVDRVSASALTLAGPVDFGLDAG